ncbi:hypothetical protein CYY_002599 [Polysphondylium violaceum]|uniref:Ras guanine nucleotide exchange factor n=1 Tax=Polysphondylium violaceum TaxID=133409 RepID=A0A8J4PZ24_9MYCE|nr:hypothetical protein CYY_002599 [Polysphondylium violaceum]
MAEISLMGVTAIICQKDNSIWKNIDDSLCRLEILKSEKDSKFRLVAISTDNRCIFNKWVRTNSNISKCSDLFLEIKQVSSQSSTTDFIGVNFAYKEEVEKFYNCFSKCIETLQNQRELYIQQQKLGIANGADQLSRHSISISSSISFDGGLNLLANSGGIPPPSISTGTFSDLPLPPPPTNYYDNHTGLPIDLNSLPPPPPVVVITPSSSSPPKANTKVNTHHSVGFRLPPPAATTTTALTTAAANLNLGSSQTPINGSPPVEGSLTSSSSGSTAGNALQDLFAPPKPGVSITTTTIRVSANNTESTIMKTSSGRKSIRARSSTAADQQKKTIGKKDGLAISLQNVEGLQNIAENLEDETLNLLDLVNEKVVNPSLTNNNVFMQSIQKLYEHLQILFILSAESAKTHHGAKIVQQITSLLARGPSQNEYFSGISPTYQWYNLDEVNSSVAGIHNLQYVKKNLIPTIAHLSTAVRVLGLQASLEVDWMSRNKSSEPEKIVVQLAALSRELINAMVRLMAATTSYCSVCNSINTLKAESPSNINRIRSPSTADLVNIWDELKQLKTPLPTIPKDGSILKVTLNQLLLLLTSETNYDSKFMKTFITTYQSFASPGLLFSKLIERFNVPDWYSKDRQKILTIQQRVIVVLKYWIENQSSDFDQDVIDQIYYFIDHTLATSSDGYGGLAKQLRELLDLMIQDREVKFELLFQMPGRISFQEDSILSPIELFSEWSPQFIAQQLTLIDFSIFKEIEPRELLNQNFNKPKFKYRSPNVMRLINRSTQFSFWVAMTILMDGKKEKRLKNFEKFCDVAKHLYKMNNFNTLMSLIAGLNLTPVHRLKKTKKKLSSSATSMLDDCEKLFSSKKSFKNYRDHLASVTLPCIPYLGFNLTDLTFIEEGNPDNVSTDSSVPLINFKKRELIFQAWTDINHFQQTPYQFQVQEPLNTFLLHFPVLEEKELYDLSCALEPK